MKELGFNVPLSPQEDMAGVTEPFLVCSNQRDEDSGHLVMSQAQEPGGAAFLRRAEMQGLEKSILPDGRKT